MVHNFNDMNNILYRYKKICTQKYAYLGFAKYKQTYARIVNDIFQAFTFKRYSCGNECTVEFAIVPLCVGLNYPDVGFYQLNHLTPQYTDWKYNRFSEKSIENCLSEIFDAIDSILIPLFQNVTDHQSAYDCALKLSYQCEENRLNYLQKRGIKNCAKPISERISVITNNFYMALKCNDYSFARIHLTTVIADRESYINNRMNELGIEDALSCNDTSIKNSLSVIEKYEKLLKVLDSKNYNYFTEMLLEKERLSLESLESYGIIKTG